jgi:hypothetical protein
MRPRIAELSGRVVDQIKDLDVSLHSWKIEELVEMAN